jgi:hypothetical protein
LCLSGACLGIVLAAIARVDNAYAVKIFHRHVDTPCPATGGNAYKGLAGCTIHGIRALFAILLKTTFH